MCLHGGHLQQPRNSLMQWLLEHVLVLAAVLCLA